MGLTVQAWIGLALILVSLLAIAGVGIAWLLNRGSSAPAVESTLSVQSFAEATAAQQSLYDAAIERNAKLESELAAIRKVVGQPVPPKEVAE